MSLTCSSLTLTRFLQVTPSSPQDENLLLEVLGFITSIIRMMSSIPQPIAQWLAQRLDDCTGPLVGLLNRSPGGGEGDDMADTSVSVKR